MNRAKNKGDRAELEAARILEDLTGTVVRRKLGAGRHDDMGDLDCDHLDCVIQVAAWDDVLSAVRQKPLGAEQQRLRAGLTHAATFVKFPRAGFRVVQTPEQFTTLLMEAIRWH